MWDKTGCLSKHHNTYTYMYTDRLRKLVSLGYRIKLRILNHGILFYAKVTVLHSFFINRVDLLNNFHTSIISELRNPWMKQRTPEVTPTIRVLFTLWGKEVIKYTTITLLTTWIKMFMSQYFTLCFIQVNSIL